MARTPTPNVRGARMVTARSAYGPGRRRGMTLAVYRINPETGARIQVRTQRTVRTPNAPEFINRYSPCICPHCMRKSTNDWLHSLVAEANRRSRQEL